MPTLTLCCQDFEDDPSGPGGPWAHAAPSAEGSYQLQAQMNTSVYEDRYAPGTAEEVCEGGEGPQDHERPH